MQPDLWHRVSPLFERALDLAPEERDEFVESVAGGDEVLRRELVELLAADAQATEFLERPALAAAPVDGPEHRAAAGLPGGRVGPYRLLEVLGHGGMGTVYLAERDEGFQRRVAVKVLRRDLPLAELHERLEVERQVLARLEHPGIARLYDGGTTADGRPYLVMEHVEGEPIDVYCRRLELPVEARLRLFLEVCDAVEHAHRNLLVHRDLKPENILVTAEGSPKLLDFGIAKLLDFERFALPSRVTRTGFRPMTPAFASPEQVRGESVTTASDVYSLGVLLFHLLTGRGPYRPRTDLPHGVEAAVLEQEPPRPSEVAAGKLARRLSGDLDTIVHKALRKEPERRYGSVRELAEDLTRHLKHRPVLARPEGLLYRAGKLVRRHTLAVAAATLLAVVLVGFGVVTFVQSGRLARERDLAQLEGQRAARTADLLFELLSGADPAQAQGSELTVREVLDRGAARLADLGDQPALQAATRATLGVVYRRLGLFDRAEPLLEETLAQRRRLHRGDHPEVAESLRELGLLKVEQGEYEAGERLLRQALVMRRELFGPAHPQQVQSLADLGGALYWLGRYGEAEEVLREAIDLARLQGVETQEHAGALNDLSLVMQFRRQLDEAERLGREALAMRRRLFGEHHPDIGVSFNNLAVLMHMKGDLEAAEELHRRSVALHRRLFGGEHPAVALVTYNLARLVHYNGELDEAEALYREALAISRRALGPHLYTSRMLQHLARLRAERGDFAEAETLLRECVGMLGELEGPEGEQVGYRLSQLADVVEAQGREQEAMELRRRAVELGATSPAEENR